MKIELEYIEEWLLETESKKMPHPFKIYFKLDGFCYPDDEWFDNGAIIVGWWLYKLILLIKGSHNEDLVFMEGPFRLKVSRISNTKNFEVTTGDLKKTAVVTLPKLSLVITNCAKEIIEIFSRYGIADSARKSLIKGISEIELSSPGITEDNNV